MLNRTAGNINHEIHRCIQGDHKYQKIIYERYRGFAFKTVFRYIYHYEKASDVVNDGFVRFFKHLPGFIDRPGIGTEKLLMGWLKKIMINSSIDELRKGSMLPEIGAIPDEVWDIPGNTQDADQLLLYKELMVLVKELPPAYRIAFNLFVIDGYSHIEIAALMNITIGTSKSNVSRARALLQKKLKRTEEIKYAGYK